MLRTAIRASVLAGCVICGWGQQTSLKGLSRIRLAVVVDEGNGIGTASDKVLTKDFQISASAVQTESELRFREAGLSIAAADRPTYPVLVVTISAAGKLAAVVRAILLESATLDRGSLRYVVISWNQSAVLQAPDTATIRECVRDIESAFLNQWLADGGK
ncbi:MAG TPA: hypothetical protein VN736_17805 [Candidatus Limnocylindrales bacterium]|nr:hypothetical protein [Candidatus Limnocylindrales bacterium]